MSRLACLAYYEASSIMPLRAFSEEIPDQSLGTAQTALISTATPFVYEMGACLQNGATSHQGRKPHYGTTAEDRMNFRGGGGSPILTSIGTESVTGGVSDEANDRC